MFTEAFGGYAWVSDGDESAPEPEVSAVTPPPPPPHDGLPPSSVTEPGNWPTLLHDPLDELPPEAYAAALAEKDHAREERAREKLKAPAQRNAPPVASKNPRGSWARPGEAERKGTQAQGAEAQTIAPFGGAAAALPRLWGRAQGAVEARERGAEMVSVVVPRHGILVRENRILYPDSDKGSHVGPVGPHRAIEVRAYRVHLSDGRHLDKEIATIGACRPPDPLPAPAVVDRLHKGRERREKGWHETRALVDPKVERGPQGYRLVGVSAQSREDRFVDPYLVRGTVGQPVKKESVPKAPRASKKVQTPEEIAAKATKAVLREAQAAADKVAEAEKDKRVREAKAAVRAAAVETLSADLGEGWVKALRTKRAEAEKQAAALAAEAEKQRVASLRAFVGKPANELEAMRAKREGNRPALCDPATGKRAGILAF